MKFSISQVIAMLNRKDKECQALMPSIPKSEPAPKVAPVIDTKYWVNQPIWIFVHHTGGTLHDAKADTSHHTFKDVNDWHSKDPNVKLPSPSSLGFWIGYHYFLEDDGMVYQGRADGDEGAHARGFNKISIGVCLAGNFDVKNPTDAQVQALKKLLLDLCKKYNIPPERIVPHRHSANKSCYGNLLSDDWARNLVTNK